MVRRTLAAVALALACTPAAVAAAAAAEAPGQTPVEHALYSAGPTGRYLLDGPWLYRPDQGAGLSQGFQGQTTTDGWQVVSVPNAWNATDLSRASFQGSVGWYRKDFRLPPAAAAVSWLVRFESVNYRATIWLNGHPIGTHAGAYLPFEVALPAADLAPGGVNRLTAMVDNRHGPTDFPPSAASEEDVLQGGWWNFGGLLREVYLERVDRVGFDSVAVLPRLACPTCPATVDFHAVVRNRSARSQRVQASARYGTALAPLAATTLAPGASATLSGSARLVHPILWSPDRPYLYAATVDVSAAPAGGGAFTHAAHYALQSGVRQVSVSPAGRLTLNGRPLDFRGVGMIEDSPQAGAAIGNDVRARYMAEAKDLG
ncbi:MAG: beta galactosidase jelly roll domain-containing protein, partial [Actinobacteria bacterium]|nr:beta galactosidase jelly roll domain-containing protein [Actinomycetota bacterium]